MATLSIHGSNLSALSTNSTPLSKTLSPKPSIPLSSKPSSFHLIILSVSSLRRTRSLHPLSAASAAEALEAPTEAAAAAEEEPVREKVNLKVVVKGMEKPRVVLRFIWMEKNIGLALDQVIPGHGTIPLSPYYWWPRKDAWEELKSKLEEKQWISQKRMIILLNQATDIINLWQQSGAPNL